MPPLRQCRDYDTFREVQATGNASMAGSVLGLPVQVVGTLTAPSPG